MMRFRLPIVIKYILPIVIWPVASHVNAQFDNNPLLLFNYDPYSLHQVFEFPIAFLPDEDPFGQSYDEWCKAWTEKVYNVPCERHPLFAEITEENVQVSDGPVIFLFGSTGSTVKRTVTIPKEKGVFFPVINYIATYPCPYSGFKPAPGQSLQDFLHQSAADFVDQGTHMTVTLDGQRLTNLRPFRVATDLFYMQARPELTCLDNCVTGELQPVLADGYWVMLRPLSPGRHLLHYKGSYEKLGWVVNVTYEILVE